MKEDGGAGQLGIDQSQTATDSNLNCVVFFLTWQKTFVKPNSLELLHEGAMVGKVLPETLEDSADMVPYSELIVELAGGACMLDIWPEDTVVKSKRGQRPYSQEEY